MRRRSDGGGDGGGGGRGGGGGAGSQRAKTKTPHKDVGKNLKDGNFKAIGAGSM